MEYKCKEFLENNRKSDQAIKEQGGQQKTRDRVSGIKKEIRERVIGGKERSGSERFGANDWGVRYWGASDR